MRAITLGLGWVIVEVGRSAARMMLRPGMVLLFSSGRQKEARNLSARRR